MNKLYLLLFFSIYFTATRCQVVTVSGQCMTSTIILSTTANVDGKVAFLGTGTVDGNANVSVSVFWIPAPDNLWVLAFDGQPYYQNSCNTANPWGTGNGSCPWSAVSGQLCTGAAALAINVTGVLPVSFTNFTAGIQNKRVVLNWKTASESNNKGFDIQRSQDGISWNTIGFVNGSVNASVEKTYQFTDANPLSGKAIYRLRQVNQDGNFTYSSIATVQFLKADFYSLTGNSGNNRYQVNLAATSQKVELSLLDAGGKKLMVKQATLGVETIDLSKYAAGIYILQIRKGNELFTEKLFNY